MTPERLETMERLVAVAAKRIPQHDAASLATAQNLAMAVARVAAGLDCPRRVADMIGRDILPKTHGASRRYLRDHITDFEMALAPKGTS